jgi:hypothetical protein
MSAQTSSLSGPPSRPAAAPGIWWYGLAGLLAAAGIALSVVLAVSGAVGFSKMAGRQLVVPGTHTVSFDRPGQYVLYHEPAAVVGGRSYAALGGAPGLRCALVEKATGEEVPTARTRVNVSYSWGRRSGRSLLQFRIDRPGAYELSAGYGAGSGPPTVLAVGRGFPARGLASILSIFVVLPLSLLGAFCIALVTYLRRRRAGKRPSGAPVLPVAASGG